MWDCAACGAASPNEISTQGVVLDVSDCLNCGVSRPMPAPQQQHGICPAAPEEVRIQTPEDASSTAAEDAMEVTLLLEKIRKVLAQPRIAQQIGTKHVSCVNKWVKAIQNHWESRRSNAHLMSQSRYYCKQLLTQVLPNR